MGCRCRACFCESKCVPVRCGCAGILPTISTIFLADLDKVGVGIIGTYKDAVLAVDGHGGKLKGEVLCADPNDRSCAIGIVQAGELIEP